MKKLWLIMAVLIALLEGIAGGMVALPAKAQTLVIPGCPNSVGNIVPCSTPGLGNAGFPYGAVPITASNTGTTSTVATLTGVANKTTYACGISVGVSGATSAGVGTVVVSGTVSASLNFAIFQDTLTSTSGNLSQLTVPFSPCIPSSAVAGNIVVTSTMGAGTTNNAVSAWGFVL